MNQITLETIKSCAASAVEVSDSFEKAKAIKAAYDFANIAHTAAKQKRKYTGENYIVHPLMVANTVKLVGAPTEWIMAALLHDVVEDTGIPNEMILYHFGHEVAGLVKELTDTPKEAGNRESRKKADLERLKDASPGAQTIKLADLISNTLSIVEHDPEFAEVYLKEKKNLLEVLQKGNTQLWVIAEKQLQDSEMELALRPIKPKNFKFRLKGEFSKLRSIASLEDLVVFLNIVLPLEDDKYSADGFYTLLDTLTGTVSTPFSLYHRYGDSVGNISIEIPKP